jgi:hypothetical protein
LGLEDRAQSIRQTPYHEDDPANDPGNNQPQRTLYTQEHTTHADCKCAVPITTLGIYRADFMKFQPTDKSTQCHRHTTADLRRDDRTQHTLEHEDDPMISPPHTHRSHSSHQEQTHSRSKRSFKLVTTVPVEVHGRGRQNDTMTRTGNISTQSSNQRFWGFYQKHKRRSRRQSL